MSSAAADSKEAAERKANWEQMKDQMQRSYGQLMNGYQKGDWKVTSKIYGPNCTISAPNQTTVKTRDAAEKYWKDLKEKTGVTKMQLKCEEINGSGDFYFERGSYLMHRGDKIFEERKYLKVWRKWEGQWFIYNYIFNSLPVE